MPLKRKILLVDGYNMIAFWQETHQLFARGDLDAARTILLDKLSNYASFEGLEIICVFDAQYMPGIRQSYEAFQVTVVFTEEEETADDYIERLAAELNAPRNQVSVATSDLNEQWTVFAQGALRVSARELEKRVADTKSDLNQVSDQISSAKPPLRPMDNPSLRALQKMMEKEKHDL
ncbi:hypothetical protein STRDD11_01401 [Streptococcus sp. DD11]|uniref:NYN domain-containing protein n=1 Tax=Streptococcus sp. DD11 TaxID=1777879 RepID=UPI000794DDD4|nr:NYN domain-containing protein [Streptococcus sp. DD11]KXT83622.1 hypothetical protein STRDD11_01401 [Streptococcus sp. DD11]